MKEHYVKEHIKREQYVKERERYVKEQSMT